MLLVPIVYSWNGDAAAFRADDLEPQIARFAFDAGNVGFANAWVALGSFAICCGWVIASTRFLPRWLGWLAVASGVGLILSRAVWTSSTWLLPYPRLRLIAWILGWEDLRSDTAARGFVSSRPFVSLRPAERSRL